MHWSSRRWEVHDLAEEFKRHSGEQCLNIVELAFSLSGYVNGVSERHAQTTKKIFPGLW